MSLEEGGGGRRVELGGVGVGRSEVEAEDVEEAEEAKKVERKPRHS